MTKINTNIGALMATTYGFRARSKIESAAIAISSGRRINSASDDAAGLAVANKLKSQIKGMQTAYKNTSNGMSLLQSALAGMQTSLNISHRLRELAIQSHNGAYTDADRINLQNEVVSLQNELQRVAVATKFNNINLLDGSYEQIMRVGNSNQEIVSVNIDGMGINNHVEGTSYATGYSSSLLSPSEQASGISVFDTTSTSFADGEMTSRFKASETAAGISKFNILQNTIAEGTTTLYTLPTSIASGTSSFDTPLTSLASGSSILDYLSTNNASGSSVFDTPTNTNAAGISSLDISATSSGVVVNNADNSALSNATGTSERVLKLATTASGSSQLNRLTRNDITETESTSLNNRILSSGYSVSSDLLTNSEANVAAGGLSTLQPLAFINSNFSGEPTSRTIRNGEATQQINGWQVHLKQISLSSSAPSSLRRAVAGIYLPSDSTQPAGSSGDGTVVTSFAGNDIEFIYTLQNDGITIGTNDVMTAASGIIHGPYIISDSAVALEDGDRVSFNWQGVGSGDAADVAAFLIDENDGTVIELLDYTHNAIGETPVFSVNETINRQGNYKFAFISGSYDENGGGRVGSQISLTNLSVTQANPANARVTNASVTVEAIEASTVTIAPNNLVQMQNKASQDLGAGTYSIVSRGADYTKFSIDQNGEITSNQPLSRAAQDTYNFDVEYVASTGKTHIETVTLNLQSGLGANSNFTVQEADLFNINRQELTLLDDFYAISGGGSFSIGARADGAQFNINANGNISSRSAMNFEDGTERNFDVIFTASDGRIFTNQVHLTLLDSFESTGNFVAEEAESVTISGSSISSSAAIANADGHAGTFELSGIDSALFSLDGAGNIISNGPLRLAEQQTYNLKYIYDSPNFASTHIEDIKLTLTEALQATSILFANEADAIQIKPNQISNLNEYAARDNYGGSYSLGPSNTDADDYSLFQIDSNGTVTSRNSLDPLVQNQFSFQVLYTDSAGEVFTETIDLTLASPAEPVTTIRATETQSLVIANSQFSHTSSTSAATPLGSFSLRGTDSNLFSIDVNGNITSNQGLYANHSATYNPTRTYNFIIDYSSGGTVLSSENVRLRILESLNATASFSAQESTEKIHIDAEDLSALDAFVKRDRQAGNYSLSSTGGDHLLFSVDDAGNVTSNTGLEFDTQEVYQFNVSYLSSDGQLFSEAVTLNLTDTFLSIASLTAEETQSLIIDNTTLASTFAFYSKDPGVGNFQLSNTDAGLFNVDGAGNIVSNTAMLKSAKEDYRFDLVYTASNGDTHVESISLRLTEALQGSTTLSAVESGQVNILLDRLTNLSGFASRDGSRGHFSIETAGNDYNKFQIAANGNITSTGSLDFDTQQSYQFTVVYLASDGQQFRDTVTLNLIDTLNSTGQFTAEEATEVVIPASELLSTATFAAKDPGLGSYSISGADATYFTMFGNEIRSNQALKYQIKNQYQFDLVYASSTGDVHIEAITVNLTPSLQSDSSVQAKESNRVELSIDTLTDITNFATADGYNGSWILQAYDNEDGDNTNDGDADDYTQFSIDSSTRTVYAVEALDFSVEDTFHFNLVYRASDGREFTDRVVLSLEDTLASSAVMEVEEADQIVINIADLTASNTYATRNPGGVFSIGAGSDLFTIQGNQIIANKEFRKEEQDSYNFELVYTQSGVQHVEDVRVDLTRFMQSEGTFTALESNRVFINRDRFTFLDDFADDVPGGQYQLSGADAALFAVNDSGNIYSVGALNYGTQQSYNINFDYVVGSQTFSSEITLGLEDTLTSQATLTVEEAQSVVVQGSLLTSLQTYAARDGNRGSFELLAQGDHDKFTMATDGTLTSVGELRMADDPVLDLYIRYNSSSTDDFVEHVQLNLTPTSYDHSRSLFEATESGEVIIVPQINTFLAAYAEADNYAGTFELAQSPYTTVRDHIQFEIDGNGQIRSTSQIDYESGRTEYEVTVYYNHSSGAKRYTDYRRLDIINDKRDDNNLALEGIDISTREGAAEAAELLNDVIVRISSSQAKLGAIENRFTHNIDNLSMNIMMSEQANSRIIDADYATESTRMARSQILQQAATNMLINANQTKQNLLMLIG